MRFTVSLLYSFIATMTMASFVYFALSIFTGGSNYFLFMQGAVIVWGIIEGMGILAK